MLIHHINKNSINYGFAEKTFLASSVRRPVIDQGPVIDQLEVIGY